MTDRARTIAVSFAKRYYSTLVEDVSQLGLLYMPTARIEHHGRKAHSTEVQALLSSLYPQGEVTGVSINAVTAVRTASGATEVEITGSLTYRDREQAFRQKAQLREVLENTFAIITDNVRPWVVVSHAAATNWALAETTPVATPPPARTATPPQESRQATAAATPAAEAAALAKTPEPSTAAPAAAAEPVDLSGLSFAERLRLRQSSKAAGDHVVRVTATTEAEAAARAAAKEKAAAAARERKERERDGEAKEPKKARQMSEDQGDGAAADGAAAAKEAASANRRDKRRKAIVYYDIVVKGLPATASEAFVRELVGTAAAVRLVKLESAPAKKDARQIRTFAFVQLDQPALKAAGQTRAEAIAAVLSDVRTRKVLTNNIQMEEVHDKLLPEKE
ncbi:mucin-associated surface protein (MASP) [Strigomonas culicis]|uniref:Mucin-associated surface protein (MASP) n=1 Tax=Strigomonas culicis TaxID=28005 RepID=S9TET3_9TRYP|nr:mucin-associated surface protein (MASP) [Strigomonas culicis]|eukprot:EPY16552.1 mucin-associated surface protein (MASP) [Strigomonas culicis]